MDSETHTKPTPTADDSTTPDTTSSDKTEHAPEESSTQTAPADALSRTPDELEQEEAEAHQQQAAEAPKTKKISFIRRLFRRINIYLLIFILVLVVAGIITWVTYLNNTKTPSSPSVASQNLTTSALKQLANTDASVGDSSQTLTIQGNTIIAGQTLARGNVNVAGNFQTGGSITTPSLTVSGATNLGSTQASSLQISTSAAIQGSATLGSLSVSGDSSFGGAITASQITVSRLILSGNATLQVPNHIGFSSGSTPNRSINAAVLGGGGSASISGSDTSGTVNVNTGNSPTAGCFVQLTFTQSYSNMPHVIISPVGVGAGQTQYYVNRSQSGFSICTAAPAPAHQSFAFDYFVTN